MANELRRQQTIDPSTAEILEGVETKMKESRLPREARSKKLKEREKARSRLPGRVNWDLPPSLKNQVVAVAEQNGIPASQVAAFLLADGLNRLAVGEINFAPYRVPSKSPRYDWNLVIPGEA